MSHSFPPPPKRIPWWKFRTVGSLRTDRGHYRQALENYDRARAAHGFSLLRHPGWFRRHKITSAFLALFILFTVIGIFAPPPPATVAGLAPAQTTTAPPAAVPTTAPASTGAPAPSPTAQDTAAAERARAEAAAAAKKAAAERAAAAKKAAVTKAAAKKAAARKAAAKKAAAKKAAAERVAVKKAAAKRRAREREDARNTFANCMDMNSTYPHGVGRPGARDRSSGPRVTNFKVSQHIYSLNTGSDRDSDGIACEKR